ncbi:DMT family transporter [Streptomyces globisporus]|uniref:DMT family transporter n=1 Tax=Streptomyces globisporus TaxID=1908 RepID=UPI00368A27F5
MDTSSSVYAPFSRDGSLMRFGDTDPLLVATGRTAVCCAVLSAFAAGRRDTKAQVRDVLARPGRLALLALLGFAAYAVGTLLAIGRIGTSLTNLVVALLPCAGLAIGALFFGERPRPRQVVGAGIAAAATAAYAFAASGTGRFDTRGLLLAVAGMLAFALYGFLYRGRMADVVPLAALPPLLGAATLMMIPLTLTTPGATAAQWGAVALLGGAVYAPAYLVQHRLILLRGPVFTAAVQLAVPFTVRLGDWALGDAASPSAAELALLVCGVVGIALVTVDRPRAALPAFGRRTTAASARRPRSR